MMDGPPVDMAPAGPCWPLDNRIERGSVVLGMGPGPFSSMPDEVPLVYGEQGGFHFEVHSRMTGLRPGNPADLLDPANPRTKFTTTFLDTGKPINAGVCAHRLAYIPSGAETFDLGASTISIFETCYRGPDVFGVKFRLIVEVIDSDGGYAKDERIVTALPPVGWVDPVPASDAGTPDAGTCPPPAGT
ncbi:MAG: hypothetical protein H0T42_32190 [Deltaproteobacteria bacterium]|nr:hypothetical protein [Deltaproteobacteria bacterium]